MKLPASLLFLTLKAILVFLTLNEASAFVVPQTHVRTTTAMGASALLSPKKRVIDAVAELGGRVTAADVAGKGASDLVSAERELLELASRFGSKATLEATEGGDVVFNFGKSPIQTLSAVDRKERWIQRWEAVKPKAMSAGRVAFGLCLFVSFAVVTIGLMVVSTAGSSSSDENNNSRREPSYGGGGGGFYYFPSPYLYMDLLFPPRYGYYEVEEKRRKRPEEMNFLEAIFSYVFGDGDPNINKRTAELERAAAIIRQNDGVVVAEQLAPVLADAPPANAVYDAPETTLVDETYVLPIVTALGGRAEVIDADNDAAIVYVFDDLVDGAVAKGGASTNPLEEKPLTFSRATDGQRFAAGALGVANLFAVGLLGFQLLAKPWLLKVYPLLGTLMVPLLLYAVSYNVVPWIRGISVVKQNEAIDDRNERRHRALMNLKMPTPSLRRKLKAAKDATKNFFVRRRRGRSEKVVFSTDDDLSETRSRKAADDLAAFDQKLSQKQKDLL